jgi:DNA-binding transcriptional ArsR family regulator
MYDSIIFELQAQLCDAMSHPARQKIIHILFDGKKSVGDIVDLAELGQSLVSRHLAILKRAGVVTSVRHGQEIYYEVSNPRIADVCELMRKVLSEQLAQSSERIERLKSYNLNQDENE